MFPRAHVCFKNTCDIIAAAAALRGHWLNHCLLSAPAFRPLPISCNKNNLKCLLICLAEEVRINVSQFHVSVAAEWQTGLVKSPLNGVLE